MKTFIRAVSILCATVLLAVAGYAAAPPNAGAGPVGSAATSAISAQVHHKLAMLVWYGVFDNLAYQVNGSEVVLTGQVISEHDQTKYNAENAVKTIPGVTQVVNNIEVLPLSPLDNRIRRDEYRAIFSQPNLGRYSMGAIPQIHIIVRGGHVSLEGAVMNQMDRNIAGLVANTVPGVFSVTNNLRVG